MNGDKVKCFMLLLFVLLFSRGSTYSQTDTMVVELGSIIKKYAIADISYIYFGVTNIRIDEINKINEILNSFTLKQNYPNPFNPTTAIAYNLPQSGYVSVRIFDMNGKLIRELVAGQKEAGEHTVTWDSKNSEGTIVSSGVFFYQVQYNNSILTKKMIFIK